jgi:hypothetical protein
MASFLEGSLPREGMEALHHFPYTCPTSLFISILYNIIYNKPVNIKMKRVNEIVQLVLEHVLLEK